MGDLSKLRDGYALLKTGNLWASTGRCKGYAAANPGEAAQIDQYVAALVAGGNPTIPSLSTATGKGLVEIIAGGYTTSAPPPPPPPPPPPSSRWYSDTAAWNVAIPSGVAIHPDSPAIIARCWVPQGANNYNNYWLAPTNSDPTKPTNGPATAVAYPTATTPLVTVQLNYNGNTNQAFCGAGGTMRVPIPAGFDGGHSSNIENKVVVWHPSGVGEWDFFDMSPPGENTLNYQNEAGYSGCAANSNWQALSGYWFPNGGFLSSQVGEGNWSDSSLYFAGGIIRRADVQNTPAGGNWGHALLLDFAFNTNGSTTSWGATYPTYVFPATSGDGKVASGVPMGARFQLDPSINVDTWPSSASMAEWAKQMLRTMQVYGLIVGHTASAGQQGNGDGIYTEWPGINNVNFDGWKYPWQNSDGSVTGYSPANAVPPDLLPHFRVIDWNSWSG